MREDIELKEFAESLGFTAEVSSKGYWQEGVPYDAYTFVLGNYYIWSAHTGWRLAKLNDGRFTRQTTLTSLKDQLIIASNKHKGN